MVRQTSVDYPMLISFQDEVCLTFPCATPKLINVHIYGVRGLTVVALLQGLTGMQEQDVQIADPLCMEWARVWYY